jgi:hypothetical protein
MDAAFAPWLADPELALAAPFLAAAVGGLTGRRVRAAFATALGLIIAAVLAASIAARLMGGGRILGAMGPAGEWRYELDAFSACALAGVFALGAALAAAAAASNDADARPGPAAPVASANAVALALNHAAGYMAHDQIALAAASPESRAARAGALKPKK